MLYFSGKGCSEFPKKVLILIGILKIPVPDIAISMGCNVGCPFIERPFDDNWGLEDPTGKSDEEFKKVIDEIRMQIFILKQRLDEFEEN